MASKMDSDNSEVGLEFYGLVQWHILPVKEDMISWP